MMFWVELSIDYFNGLCDCNWLRWNRTFGNFLFIHLITANVPRMLTRSCLSELDAVHTRYLPCLTVPVKTLTEFHKR
jgi:hypothetical protein